MDIVKPFFDMDFTTMCGIPFVKIEGTKNDWVKMRSKIENFVKYDLEWWVDAMRPVLDEFVSVFDNKPNTEVSVQCQ